MTVPKTVYRQRQGWGHEKEGAVWNKGREYWHPTITYTVVGVNAKDLSRCYITCTKEAIEIKHRDKKYHTPYPCLCVLARSSLHPLSFSCSTGFSWYAPCKCWSMWAPPFMLLMMTWNHVIRKWYSTTRKYYYTTHPGKVLWRFCWPKALRKGIRSCSKCKWRYISIPIVVWTEEEKEDEDEEDGELEFHCSVVFYVMSRNSCRVCWKAYINTVFLSSESFHLLRVSAPSLHT